MFGEFLSFVVLLGAAIGLTYLGYLWGRESKSKKKGKWFKAGMPQSKKGDRAGWRD